MRDNNFKMYNRKGISLISLIITIIVIIILAAIPIFTGLSTPDTASFSKFVSEFSDFNLAIENAYLRKYRDYSVGNKIRSRDKIYYEIATGVDVGESGEPEAIDTVASLGNIYPETLEGTEYYEITSDKNVLNWNIQKVYYDQNEKHYMTDEGEAFVLPGYLVQEEDGTNKWWINEEKYYTGEAKTAE